MTALARPAPAAQATPALSTKHSVEIIDEAKPGDVGVIVMEAQAIDDRERGMYPFIREFKSLQKAIAKFNRI